MQINPSTTNELILFGAIIGVIIGSLVGLVSLILGIKKKKQKLGLAGFVCSIVVGAISGLLSIVVTGIFVWLILKKPKAEIASETKENFNSDSEIS